VILVETLASIPDVHGIMERPLAVLTVCLLLVGCASSGRDRTAELLEAQREHPGVALEGAAAEEAVDRFREFYRDVTAERVAELAPGLYAGDVYFNDTLKTLRGRDEVTAYFQKTADATAFVRATIEDVAWSGSDCYVRWVMDVGFKDGGEPIKTPGMTQLRFNSDGLVVLHQDYWDSAGGFYDHLPVVGGLLAWIRSML
jgi:hypothetical protein